MFSSLTKSTSSITNKKSYDYNYSGSCLYSYDNVFNYSNQSRHFVNYYLQSSPVFTAIKLIGDNLLSIQPILKQTKQAKDGTVDITYMDQHPILDLLKNPNPFMDYRLLIKSLVSYFILTGNGYLEIITSSQGGKPIGLNVFNPEDIRIQANTRDGYPQEYDYNTTQGSNKYIRDRLKTDTIFVAQNGNELAHLRNFNPNYSNNNLYGVSDLAACEIEISQYILASIHNNSLLKNQARPSGLLTFKGNDDIIGEDSINEIKETIRQTFSGSANAGKTAILGGNFEWKQMSESIKDMDFATLKKMTAEAVYNALKIPLPMVSPDNMTLANMEQAKLNFYDNTILPLAKVIFDFLNDVLLRRFPNTEGLELTFDKAAIEALEPRQIDNALKMSNSGVLTINEIRSQLGYDAVEGGGGDVLYQPMNLVPVASDSYIGDNRKEPSDKSMEKAALIEVMKRQKTIKGDRLYSDDEISKTLKKHYD